MKKLLFLIVFIISNLGFSQILNQYKYAIIPEKYLFQKNKNDYNLSELTKAALRKYGFEPYYDSEILPKDISNDNKVYVDVLENSTMIYTKLIVVLRDYTNNVLFRSAEGKSKEKEFDEAYEECFRQAVKSLDIIKHQFIPTLSKVTNTITASNENVYALAILYHALKISNGFKLFENGIFKYAILETSNPNIFFVNTKDDNIPKGILIQKSDGLYSLEYYIDGTLIKLPVNILF